MFLLPARAQTANIRQTTLNTLLNENMCSDIYSLRPCFKYGLFIFTANFLNLYQLPPLKQTNKKPIQTDTSKISGHGLRSNSSLITSSIHSVSTITYFTFVHSCCSIFKTRDDCRCCWETLISNGQRTTSTHTHDEKALIK